MSNMNGGAVFLALVSPELKAMAERNSNFFKGRFEKAIQPKAHLIRSTDLRSRRTRIWVTILL